MRAMKIVLISAALLVATPALADWPSIRLGPDGITIGPSHPDWRHRGHPRWGHPGCWRRDFWGNRRWVCGDRGPGRHWR